MIAFAARQRDAVWFFWVNSRNPPVFGNAVAGGYPYFGSKWNGQRVRIQARFGRNGFN